MTYSRKRKPGNDDEVLSLLSPSTPTLSAGPCSLAAAVASSPAKRLKAHLSSHESLASESSWPSAEPSETSNQEVVHVNNESNDKNRRLFYRTLESLDKTALSGLLSQLLQRHPSLEPEVFQWLPKPTLVTVSKLLSESEDRLNAAFPYSRNAPGRTSDYAFNRVR